MNLEVQPKEAQLIFGMLAKHLKNGVMLQFMDPLEAQVTIGFLRRLKKIADYRPPVQMEVTIVRVGTAGRGTPSSSDPGP